MLLLQFVLALGNNNKIKCNKYEELCNMNNLLNVFL